jgi:uncharacterized Ntn-hydrolase superfamily protein
VTFSSVGHDPATGEIGVAVQSKFPCVGAVVPWAKAGVGAIATQAWANPQYGPHGLALLEQGLSPDAVVDRLTGGDDGAQHRQVGVLDAAGRGATYTGPGCMDWAGGLVGPHFACQGNILVSAATVEAMASAFTDTAGDLAERLTMALVAGAAAGGDSRGQQAAALYIAKAGAGYLGNNDRFVDIRVDEHPDPITELRRILGLYRILFYPTRRQDVVDLVGEAKDVVMAELIRQGFFDGDPGAPWGDQAQQALVAFYSTENFEERLTEYATIDSVVVDYLKSRQRSRSACPPGGAG